MLSTHMYMYMYITSSSLLHKNFIMTCFRYCKFTSSQLVIGPPGVGVGEFPRFPLAQGGVGNV